MLIAIAIGLFMTMVALSTFVFMSANSKAAVAAGWRGSVIGLLWAIVLILLARL